MKKGAILLSLVALFTVSCVESELEPQISNVSWTPCEQNKQGEQSTLKSETFSDKVDVEFSDKGIQILYYDFEVPCDFTTVNVTHTFVNGVLNITQQGFPNQANCVCYTNVSYTIGEISQDKVNVIFINGEQVYCYNNGNNQTNCDQNVIISQIEYNNAPNHPVMIFDMNIEGDCLKIKFGASGCSGDNWTVKLIDCEVVAESMPCQRTLRLSLNDIGVCEAYFEKEMSFNIKDLQIQGDRSVQLNILGKSILYEY